MVWTFWGRSTFGKVHILVDQAASLAKPARVEISFIEREQASGREEIVTPYVVKSDLNSELDRASEFILA